MEHQTQSTKVFLYQSVGFLALIGVCMLDELIGLTSLILGDQPYITDFRQSMLKMLLILAVWLLVGRCTRRVLARVQYLEEFTKVCAWCRRIDYKGRWMPLEEFLQQGYDTPTSHGICPDCLESQKSAIEHARHNPGSAPLREPAA